MRKKIQNLVNRHHLTMGLRMLYLWVTVILVGVFHFNVVEGGQVTVASKQPHDNTCFTQGIYIHGSYIYESCGLTGKSLVRMIDPQGVVVKSYRFTDEIFAEGIVIVNDILFVLTWKNRKLFVLNAHTLDPLGYQQFESKTNEGWGLAADMSTNSLILSDGSSVITFYEIPVFDLVGNEMKIGINNNLGHWKQQRQVKVTRAGKAMKSLNELEFVDGYIFANIWYRNSIIQIDPSNGKVVDMYDCGLLIPRTAGSDVLNGIAFNMTSKEFYITGKLWPVAYNVHFQSDEANNNLGRRMSKLQECDSVNINCI
jgi:glutamine cyclotransferase